LGFLASGEEGVLQLITAAHTGMTGDFAVMVKDSIIFHLFVLRLER